MNLALYTLFVATSLALSAGSGWEVLRFDNIRENGIAFSDSRLTVTVNDSASPIIYPFSGTKTVNEIFVSGTVTGKLESNGSSSWDDALLRVGIIETGSRKLSPVERMSAPKWVKTLSNRMSGGIRKIHCFLLMPEKERIGEARINPDMELFQETIAAVPSADGSFTMRITLPHAIESPGLWILSDGDDTGSKFSISIEQIEMKSLKE